MLGRFVAVVIALLLCAPAVQPVSACADVEQAKVTGGIVALYPSDVDAQRLAIPGGAPAEELHLTLVDYGEDVRGLTDVALRRRLDDLVTDHPEPIDAQVFGHAIFNPNDEQRGPSTVYIVGDSLELASLRQQVLSFSQELLEPLVQHEPWIPHMTAGYGALETELKYTGAVRFDRIGLRWAGSITYWQL
jgi:hypothetical protein